MVSANSVKRALGVEPRPDREEAEVAGEIFRPDIGRLQHQRDTDDELEQPERRGEIGHDAGREMLPRGQLQAFGADDARVLQVALAPAPVARRQGRSATAGSPRRSRRDPAACRRPSRRARIRAASTKSWLRIWPPKGGLPLRSGRPPWAAKASRADDRVVAPVIAVAAHPDGQAGGDHRAVDPRRELLQPREQGVAVDDQRQRLDDAGIGIGLHGGGKRARCSRRSSGCRRRAPACARSGRPSALTKSRDVAGLAVIVLRPVAVIEARVRAEPLAQGQEGALLRDPGIGIGRVGENEIVEMLRRGRSPRPIRRSPREPRRSARSARCRPA